jgi:hypothetical protein
MPLKFGHADKHTTQINSGMVFSRFSADASHHCVYVRNASGSLVVDLVSASAVAFLSDSAGEFLESTEEVEGSILRVHLKRERGFCAHIFVCKSLLDVRAGGATPISAQWGQGEAERVPWSAEQCAKPFVGVRGFETKPPSRQYIHGDGKMFANKSPDVFQ